MKKSKLVFLISLIAFSTSAVAAMNCKKFCTMNDRKRLDYYSNYVCCDNNKIQKIDNSTNDCPDNGTHATKTKRCDCKKIPGGTNFGSNEFYVCS